MATADGAARAKKKKRVLMIVRAECDFGALSGARCAWAGLDSARIDGVRDGDIIYEILPLSDGKTFTFPPWRLHRQAIRPVERNPSPPACSPKPRRTRGRPQRGRLQRWSWRADEIVHVVALDIEIGEEPGGQVAFAARWNDRDDHLALVFRALASCNAAQVAAPEEMPIGIPSSLLTCLDTGPESVSFTRMISS